MRLRAMVSACLAVLAAAAAFAVPALAQGYPERPVRLVLPFGAGGSVDVIARLLTRAVGESWGQQIVIDNKPGADGDLGAEAVARAAPDGYTLLLTSQAVAVNVSLRPGRPYKIGDLEPVMMVAGTQGALVVPASLPAGTVGELIALAKAQPGKLDYGSTGVGTSGHLAMELLRLQTGIDMVHIPFRNIGQQMTDLIAGRIAAALPTVPGAVAHVRSGKVKLLGTSGARRSLAFPDVPTIAEAGVAGYEATTWYALFAPRGTAAAVVAKVNAVFRAAIARADVAARLAELGVEPAPGAPDELARHVSHEVERWARVIREAGIKAE